MDSNMITIVIPVFNRAALIEETLNAVIAQTSTDWNCIVVDDGSTDDTVSVVNAFAKADSRITSLQRTKEHLKGGCGARNYGALQAQTPYIMFLDSDDLITKTCVEERLLLLHENPKKDLFIFHSGVFNKELGDSNLLWNVVDAHETNSQLLERFIHQDAPWCTNGVLWQKEFFLKIGMWSEILTAWQDWELHTKSLLHDPTIIISSEKPDNFYRRDIQVTAISDARNLTNYLRSVMNAIAAIQKQFHPSQLTSALSRDLKDLFKKTIIEYPVKKGKRDIPLSLWKDESYPRYVLSSFEFFKSYLMVLMTRNYIMTKVLKKIGFKNWLDRYHRASNFLKRTTNG